VVGMSRTVLRPFPAAQRSHETIATHGSAHPFEVLQDRAHLPAGHVALSDVPLEDRRKLQAGQLTRSEAVRAIGDFATRSAPGSLR